MAERGRDAEIRANETALAETGRFHAERLNRLATLGGAEVAANEAAAESGAAYAEALEGISASQRQAFVERVNQLQAEGRSLDQAIEEAAAYFKAQREGAERSSAARIESAERARGVEVAANEAAAASGASYAEQLRQLETLAEREAFVEYVNQLQAQGFAFDAARESAARYFDLLDQGTDRDLAGSLERASLNEQRFFDQNPIGRTLGDIQSEAVQEGSAFLRSFERGREFLESYRGGVYAARDATNDFARDATRSLNALAHVTDALGSEWDTVTTSIDVASSAVRLAGGDFTALADIALIAIDFINEREEELAERRRERAERRLAFETETAERIADFSRIGNLVGDITPFLDTGRDLRSFSSGEDRYNPFLSGARTPELPTLDLQGIVDAAPDISEVLTGVLEQQLTAALVTAAVNGEDLSRVFDPFIENFRTAMTDAGADFRSTLRADVEFDVISRSLEGYTTAISDFYQLRIDEIRALDRLIGSNSQAAIFALQQQSDRATQDAENQARLAGPQIGRSRFSQFQLNQQLALNRTPEEIDAEYASTFAEGDPNAQLDFRGGIDDLISDVDISNLQTQADAAIEVFRDAITAPARTIESIDEALATLLPTLQTLYDNIREQIIGPDGIISDAEQMELNNLGTFEDFTAQYTGLADQAKADIQTAKQLLESFRAGSAFSDNVEAFKASLSAPGITVAEINQALIDFQPTLRSEFERLRAEIIGTDGIISDAEQLSLEQRGLDTFENFTQPFRELADAAIGVVETAAEALAIFDANSAFDTSVQNFKESLNAAGLTVEDIDRLWADFQEDVLRPRFEYLRSLILDDDGVISDAEELELKSRGLFTFEDFTDGFIDIRDGAVMATETVTEALAQFDANSEFDTSVQNFKSSINAAGITVEAINTLFEAFQEDVLRPRFEYLRSLILDDDGVISDAEELALKTAGLFTFEDFTAGFRGLADTAIANTQKIQRQAAAASQRASQRAAGQAQRAAEQARRAEEALANVRGNAALNDALEELVSGFIRTATTDAELARAIDQIVSDPRVIAEYERRVALISGPDGIINTAAERAEFEGSPLFGGVRAWVNTLIDPSVTATQAGINSLKNITADAEFNNVLEALLDGLIRTATTDAELASAIDQIVSDPRVIAEYERQKMLIGGENGIIDTAAEEAAFRDSPLFGGVRAWVNTIIDPSVTATQAGIDSLENFTANTEFNDALESLVKGLILTAMTDGELETAIETIIADPRVIAEYDRRKMLIGGENGIIDTAAEIEAFENSPLANGVDAWIRNLIDPSVSATQSGIDALGNITGSKTFNDALEGLIKGFILTATTDAELDTGIQKIISDPKVIDEYDRRKALIGGEDGIINTAAEQAAFEDSPLSDGVDAWVRGLIQPSVTATQSGIDALGNITGSKTFNDALEGLVTGLIQTAMTDGELESAIQQIISDPRVIAEYDRRKALFGGEDGIVNTAAELAEFEDSPLAGGVDAWVRNLIDPSVSATQAGIDSLEDFTGGKAFNDAIEPVLEGLITNAESEADLAARIQALISDPQIIAEYNRRRELAGGINNIIDTAAETQLAAGLGVGGSVEDFVASLLPDNIGETVRDRQTRTGLNLQSNRVQRATVALRNASSEEEFTRLQGILRRETNTYFDLEEQRINGLKLSEGELQDLREKNFQARIEALADIENIESARVENEKDRKRRLLDIEEELPRPTTGHPKR